MQSNLPTPMSQMGQTRRADRLGPRQLDLVERTIPSAAGRSQTVELRCGAVAVGWT